MADRNLIIENNSNLFEKESLVSLGLLTPESLTWTLFENERTVKVYEYGRYIVFLQPKAETKTFDLGFYSLSQTGVELISIVPESNLQYLQTISNYCKAKGVTLGYSKINYIRDGNINYALPKMIFQYLDVKHLEIFREF